MEKAIQDYYPEDVSYCYGCGSLNDHGLHIKSYWDGEVSTARFVPQPYHIAIPGYVYGGLIASLIDCHCVGTAAAALYQEEGRDQGSEPAIRCLTASLHVDYLKPTPLGVELEIRAKVKEVNGRRVTVTASVYAGDLESARGEVVAVQIPDRYFERLSGAKPD
ncbi:MAG: PaaI family thioesterase [Candidatus Promineifilaceae bacterium]|jgi:acyl-coenzyme A thioesterase PaaI-like protein